MAATALSMAPFNHGGTQCMDPDMDSFVDFGALASPTPNGSSSTSRLPPSTTASTSTSPATTILKLDSSDELQTPAKPSHEYERWKQQTGLPSGSVPGLHPGGHAFNGGFPMFSNSGLGMEEMGYGMEGTWSSGLGMGDVNMDMDMSSGNSFATYFYRANEGSPNEDFVDPSAINNQEEPPVPVRVWPGMHQQQAALAKAQAQAQQQRQQQIIQQQKQHEQQQRPQQAQRLRSHQPVDQRTEETIARVVNQIRKSSTLASQNAPLGQSAGLLPHIVKMKKDEDEMDEDERLLASEEGKKLSSKERRQLRNKVSARAFRSRRKEYISQLEGEVAQRTNEVNELRVQNHALLEENARSRALIEKLLRHPAFTPFLEDLSRDEVLNTTLPSTSSASSGPTPAPQNSFSAAPQMTAVSHAESSHVNMATIPEAAPIDMSMLNIGQSWSAPNVGFNYQQHQVFAVTELPEGPANPIDTEMLSGKTGFASELELSSEEIKAEYPIIETPVVQESATVMESTDDDEDTSDPAFALYYDSPAPSSNSTPTAPIDTFANPEKASAQFELVVSDEAASQRQWNRFERMTARIEPIYQRLMAYTSHLDI